MLPAAAGREVPFDISATPVRTQEGAIVGAVLVLVNVQHQLQAEEQLRLDERVHSLSNLASALAHEIRNPLYAISLSAQLLREDIDAGRTEPERLRETLDILQDEVARLERIVKDFRAFARPLSVKMQFGSLNDVVTKALRSLKAAAQAKRVEVVVEFGAVPEVLMDEERLVQAFVNIVKNAIEALDVGGRLEVCTRLEGDWAVVEFRDNGCGMDQEELARAFDLFFSTKEDGTGLGLPIALRIVEAHHGQIRIHSQPKVGTTVCVYLPLKIVSH